ncbi:hypothetical protein H101_06428 [Trichophyton interdigitale H6]|nr:hypothetical protein H101_06428 [Trichophyton interdigitale H6]
MSSAQILKIECSGHPLGLVSAATVIQRNQSRWDRSISRVSLRIESNLQIPSSVDWTVDPGRAMLRRSVALVHSNADWPLISRNAGMSACSRARQLQQRWFWGVAPRKHRPRGRPRENRHHETSSPRVVPDLRFLHRYSLRSL